MLIRIAKPSEVTDIANIYIDSFKRALPTIQLAHSDNDVRNWIRAQLIPKGGTWVADESNTILGFMSLDGNLLEELYLSPEAQGKGLGSKLINKAKELYPKGLKTYTFQINKIARDFYEKHGFIAISFNNGERNEENEPDVLYEWKGDK